MNVGKFHLYHYQLPLLKPFYIRRARIEMRGGMIIQLITKDNLAGFGEIAPLAGLNKETLEEARLQILSFREPLLSQIIPEELYTFDKWIKAFELFPSVRCGIEMAIMDIFRQKKIFPLDKLFDQNLSLPLSGLLQGPVDEVLKDAKHLLRQGFKSIKLKVGSKLIKDDVEKVKALRKIVAGKATLRLDANQSWTYDDAVSFAKEIGPEHIDYFEEPSMNYLRTLEFFEETRIPVALDESLVAFNPKEIKAIKGVKALVLKPTVLGGFERTKYFIDAAKSAGMQAVISSSFVTAVGLMSLANFAMLFTDAAIPAGLGTSGWFKKDLFKNPLPIENGSLNLTKLNSQKQEVNFNLLEKLSDA